MELTRNEIQKDNYDKQGVDAFRRNSMKTLRRPGSPRGPTSPRHYVTPKNRAINVNSTSETDTNASSPGSRTTPDVEPVPSPTKGTKRCRTASSSRGNDRRHKQSKSSKDGELLDPLLQAMRKGQEEQRRAQMSLEKRLAETVKMQNNVIRKQTKVYSDIFKDIATNLKSK
jgi:hypothetical protein